MNNISQNKMDFIRNVILPVKSCNINANSPWCLRSAEHKFLLASDYFAKLIGLDNHKDMIGRDLSILPFADDSNMQELYQQEQDVIKNKVVRKKINLLKIKDEILVRIVTMLPILFNNEVVAIDVPAIFINKQHFDLELFYKMQNLAVSKSNVQISFDLSNIEKKIIYLLLLDKTQYEISEILALSRSRITQIISNLCYQNNLPGSSSKLLKDFFIANNYHKKIPPEFFMI
jgi:hypothetical protein